MEAIFETNPVFLSSLLGDLKTGKIQLPDFQRGWVWDDERIRGVLASVSRSFPIGALMVLETGGETQFHPRPVEGVDLPKESRSGTARSRWATAIDFTVSGDNLRQGRRNDEHPQAAHQAVVLFRYGARAGLGRGPRGCDYRSARRPYCAHPD